ncbi:exonuclease domain-containing protein [Clostridium gasigenes]|uniref:3'-5' exonuclease n=1 Tax=Clostridium gasigenes TaxID=94869 RepID=UPI00143832BC|nr:3'-5' exonuclease [Clostridium gasigenes]NKF06347.1 exonuclease domain-containing protein [Clostridium gasigenes]QSW20230.1 exonuclease domain-containing protein [Clostridium gasigenes]
MAFIIIDLEFNNLNGINKYYPDIFNDNPDLKDIQIENEIIEIGAIKLDKYMKPLGEYKAYIKPSIIPVLNPKVLEITKILKEDLDSGISFEEGMDGLRSLIDEDDIICSWAKDDIIEIMSNAIYHKYEDLKWLKNYLDIQEYSTKILAHKNSLSLKNALEELKIRIDPSKLHDALNDAVYTSYVLKRIYNSRIIKNYVIKDIYNMPALEVKNLQEYNLDENKVKEICPKCKVGLAIEYPLKPINWRFLSLGICPKCNRKVINEVVIKKTFSGEEVYKETSTIVNEVEYINYTYKMYK